MPNKTAGAQCSLQIFCCLFALSYLLFNHCLTWCTLPENFVERHLCVSFVFVCGVHLEGKKMGTLQEQKGQISCLLEKDTCRIHARLAIAMSLLALQMCFLTHNRLQLDLIGHISLPLWTPLHLLFRVIIFTHI